MVVLLAWLVGCNDPRLVAIGAADAAASDLLGSGEGLAYDAPNVVAITADVSLADTIDATDPAVVDASDVATTEAIEADVAARDVVGMTDAAAPDIGVSLDGATGDIVGARDVTATELGDPPDAASGDSGDIRDTPTGDLGGPLDAPTEDLAAATDAPLALPDAGPASDVAPAVDRPLDAPTDAPSDAPPDDSGACDACAPVAAPRPLAPMSTATATSRSPTLRWSLPVGVDGADGVVCSDRACATVLTRFTVTGSTWTAPAALPPGVAYWRVRGRAGATTGIATSPTWQFNVPARDAPRDASGGTTLDLNGDGFADVVIGTNGSNSAYLFRGSASGLAATPITLTGPELAPSFGAAVASAGDVNGDGLADLVVGGSNTVRFYLGSEAGLVSSPTTLPRPTGAFSFGSQVASAGDINGDGFADVVVGAYASNKSFLYLGSATGLATTPTTLTGPVPGSNFGRSVASAGDVNGDGFADLVVGASRATYLYLGSATVLAVAPITLTVPGEGFNYGYAVANAGDVDGDGFTDLAVGAPDSNVVYVYPGSAAGLVTTPRVLRRSGPSAFGISVEGAGDVNGDGFADLVVGARDSSTAYLHLGGPGGLTPIGMTLADPVAGGRGFGDEVAGVGDVNGDGFADVVVAASDDNRVYLYMGGAGGLTVIPRALPRPAGSSYFGFSVAGLFAPPPSRRNRGARSSATRMATVASAFGLTNPSNIME